MVENIPAKTISRHLNADSVIRKMCRLFDDGHLEPDAMPGILVRFYRWLLADQCVIRFMDTHHAALHPNMAQRMVIAAMMLQAIQGKPIRLNILKGRKLGVSTIIQALFNFMATHYPNQVSMLLAHEEKSTRAIFSIAKLMAECYEKSWADPKGELIKYPNRSEFSCWTAGGVGVGAGGTPNLLHKSELALWRNNKKETDYAADIAVPAEPNTVIVNESTARGKELFWAKFEKGLLPDSDFRSLFIPWFIGDQYRADIVGRYVRDGDDTMLVRCALEYGIEITDEALNWRRHAIKQYGEHIFRQEFPSTPEEAVQSRAGLVLPYIALTLCKELSFDPMAIDVREWVGGYDHGYNDPTAIVTGFWHDQELWVVDSATMDNTLAREQVEYLHGHHTYYCDPSALAARKEVSQAAKDVGLSCHLVMAPRDGKAEPDSEWNTVHRLCVEGRLHIMEDVADRIIVEASQFAWNEKTGRPDDRRGEEHGHFDTLDALKYMVMGCTYGLGQSAIVENVQPEFRVRNRRDAMRRL